MSGCEITSVGVHLKVADVVRSREFYESLGFIPRVVFGDEEFCKTAPAGVRTVRMTFSGVIFKVGENAELEIANGHPAIRDGSIYTEYIQSPKISAMIRVKSLVPLFTNPLVKIRFPVRRYYWNAIEVAFRDPDGFVLVFIAPYSDEEFRSLSHFVSVEVINQPSSPDS